MNALSQLIVAALFSLHQYIPADSVETKYFDYAVDPVTLEAATLDGQLIFAAAHSSCRHLFKQGGEEFHFTEEELLNFALGMMEDKEEDLVEVQSSSKQAGDLLRRICIGAYDPQAFTHEEAQSISQFVREKVHVLKQQDLDSLGAYKAFGRVALYDRQGRDMGPLFTTADRWVSYHEISSYVPQALIAAEDQHFMVHEGVDLSSLSRMATDARNSDSDTISGGSTITMQLLKNLYFQQWPTTDTSILVTNDKLATLLRKVREWYWAKPFEKYHEKLGPGSGKRFVLENYFNLMDYGPGVRGIEQAAEVFFGKTPSELNIAEAAFIASVFKRPGRYARSENYETFTIPRRDYVLNQMIKLNFAEHGLMPISFQEKATASQTPLPQWAPVVEDLDTAEAYLRSYAKEFISNGVEYPAGVRHVEMELQTTIDADLQKIVFDTVREHLDSQDADREKLDRIGPARDDRSRIATATTADVTSSVISELRALDTRLQEMQINAHLSVYLGDMASGSGSSPQFYTFSRGDGQWETIPDSVKAEMASTRFSQSRNLGQVIITEIDAARCAGLAANEKYKNLQTIIQQYGGVSETGEVAQADTGAVSLPEVPSPTPEITEVVVPLELPALPEVPSATTDIPLPRPRPANADEIIAEQRKRREENRFSDLVIDPRPAAQIPFLPPQVASCVHVINSSELQALQLSELFNKTQDGVSKQIVYNYFQRMNSITPRSQMFPALLDGRGELKLIVVPQKSPEDPTADYSQWVRGIRLKKSHNDYLERGLRNGLFRTGQSVWVTPTSGNEFVLAAPKLQSAVVVMDSNTGEVLANFGGYYPKTSRFFDRSRLAMRPPGSTLKPWLYYMALNKGFEPYTMIQNAGAQFNMDTTVYAPDNYSENNAAYVRLDYAFSQSLNKPPIGLFSNPLFGSDPMTNVKEYIGLLAIVGLYDISTVQMVPSTALGTQEVKLADLVSSLTFFANGQSVRRPQFFKSVTSSDGLSLYESQVEELPVPYAENRVALFQMQNLLLKVANEGTAGALRNFATETLGIESCSGYNMGLNGQVCFGGKTGTSSDNKDNWFMGISKNFVIGVWVGYDLPESTNTTGGRLSLPIFMDIVKKGREHLPPIEPLVSEVPQGLHLLYLGPNQDCLADPGQGTPVYAKHDGSGLPRCLSCSCEKYEYSAYDFDYTLFIDGYRIQEWATSDDGSYDLQSCRQTARQYGCSL